MKDLKNEKHKRRSFSIKTKIALLCIGAILLSVFVTFFNMSRESVKIITESTEITLKDIANTYSQNLSGTISQISRIGQYPYDFSGNQGLCGIGRNGVF